MSSITMAADSTQSELMRRRKHKAKLARLSGKETRKQHVTGSSKSHKANSKQIKTSKHARKHETESEESCSDRDSDLDLSNELLPVAGYIGSSETLVTHMFRSISTKKLKAMLPEILKPTPLDELKSLCIEQLEGMSKKRISRILDGDDPDNISSSGTDDDADMPSSDADAEFKGDSKHTSADPSNKCHADTTHYESTAAAERSCVADDRVSAAADVSRSTEPTSVAYSATDNEHLDQSAEDAAVAAAQSEMVVDQNASVEERGKSHTVTYDLVEGSIDCQELDYDEESEAEQLSEMPGTPESLPSLVSEPVDTCMPVKFLKTRDNNDDNLPVEKSAGDERDLGNAPATEVESVHQQPSPHLLHCGDEVLASAENENNMNVENENYGNANRAVEAGNADVLTAAENSENITDLQLGEMQDTAVYVKVADAEIHLTHRSSVPELSAGSATDVREMESRDGAVLSSSSEMVIEVQDHEFSDEELEDTGKSCNDTREPAILPDKAVQPDNSSVEQHRSQQLVDSEPATVEQRQKNQPTTRVIRLNRNFSRHLAQSLDAAECRAKSEGESGHKLLPKPAVVSKRPGKDASLEQAELTRSNVTESIRPKQLKVDTSSRLSQNSQASKKVAVQKNVAAVSKTRTKVKSKLSPDDSVPVAKSVPAVERAEQVLDDQRSDATPESVRPRDQTDDSSESDPLSKTQLEILELEMRARAIKAMIRAHEEMEQLESVDKKRRSSGTADMSEVSKRQVPRPRHSLPQSSSSVRQPSSTTSRSHGELRSLQSVVGRNIIKRAEFVARRQRRIAAQDRFQPRKQFVEQRRLPQAALTASPRMVRLQSDTRLRPMRYVVTSESRPRIVQLQSGRFGMPLQFSRRQRQRHFEPRGNFALSDTSRDDKRRVLVSSDQRSVRLSSSTSRPY